MAAIACPNASNPSGLLPIFPAGALAITPSNDIFDVPVAVYVGAAGTVVVTPANGGSDVTFTALAGMTLPLMVKAVKASSTATGLIALY